MTPGSHAPPIVDLSTPRLKIVTALTAATLTILLLFGIYFFVGLQLQNRSLHGQEESLRNQQALLIAQATSAHRGALILARLDRTNTILKNVLDQAQDPKVLKRQHHLEDTIIKEQAELLRIQRMLSR